MEDNLTCYIKNRMNKAKIGDGSPKLYLVVASCAVCCDASCLDFEIFP